MRSVAVAGLLSLAPVAAAAQPAPVYLEEYVDAHRPTVVKRALTSSEKAEARALVRQIEAAPSEALLDRLRPLANSGDVALMTAMWQGYGKAVLTSIAIDDSTGQRAVILQAQWAIQLWRAGEQNREVALSISNCFAGRNYDGTLGRSRACGYVATPKKLYYNDSFTSYASKSGGKPDVTFTEARPDLAPGWAERRFERIVAELRDRRRAPSTMDMDFADAVAKWRGPAMWDYWFDLTQLAKARRFTDMTRLKELEAAYSADVRAYNAIFGRLQADRTLSDADRDAWFRLSVRIGGEALTRYALLFPLTEAWQVDAFCAMRKTPDEELCALRRLQQRSMLTTRSPGADEVPVRSYDMAGSPGRTVYVPRTAMRGLKY